MIDQKLTTYFSRYKTLTPRADFVSSSMAKILLTEQQQPINFNTFRTRFLESITVGSALALASLMLLVVLGGISYLGQQSGVATVATISPASKDADTVALLQEASKLVSSVQIKEVDNFAESSEQVVSALDKLSKEP